MNKYDEFVFKLKELMTEFDATIEHVDVYDNDEEIVGDNYYFSIGKEQILPDENNFSITISDLYDELS